MDHHHRPSKLKQQNKPHKSTARSNRDLNRKLGGRVGRSNSVTSTSSSSLAVGRAQRRQQAVDARKAKKEALKTKRRLGGASEVPRSIVVIGLSQQARPDEVSAATRSLASAVETVREETQTHAGRVRLTYVGCADLTSTLDACKAADLVVCVLGLSPMASTLATVLEGAIDEQGRTLLTCLKAQGLPTCVGAIQGLEAVPSKLRAPAKKHAITFLEAELGADVKTVDLAAGAAALLRVLTETRTHQVTWRSERSYMVGLDARMDERGALVVRGHLRGRPLRVRALRRNPTDPLQGEQIVHVCGAGNFRIARLCVLGGDMDERVVFEAVDASGEIKEEAEVDLLAGEQTWPTQEELGQQEKDEQEEDEGKEYLKGWLDEEDEASAEDNKPLRYAETKKERAKMDLDFPDEQDTPQEQPARERFAKYRGLKSLRSSPWHPMESLPREYARIHQLRDWRALQKAVLDQAERLEAECLASGEVQGCAPPGALVELRLVGVHVEQALALHPLVLGGLLEHEEKLSVVNALVQPHAVSEPVQGREELEMHCGLWRRAVRPTFSEHNLNSDKHKMERYLEPGRWTVASAYAPVTLGVNLPVLLFRRGALVASGSLLSVDPSRIVLKKVVLTGIPTRVKKGWAVVRRMFHNPQDVKWFMPVDVYTKYGASGRILDSVGTHGAMKCRFDRHITQQDTVCMALWKRVFPKKVQGMFADLDDDDDDEDL